MALSYNQEGIKGRKEQIISEIEEVPEPLLDEAPDDTEEIEVLFAPARGVWEFLDSRKKSGDLIDLRIYGFVELALRR